MIFFLSEYGLATQRMCLQRGPSDSEERCANTVWNYKKVYMCFCTGDLCNLGSRITPLVPTLFAFGALLINYLNYSPSLI